jgi:hypothetical protein
MVEIIKRLFA